MCAESVGDQVQREGISGIANFPKIQVEACELVHAVKHNFCLPTVCCLPETKSQVFETRQVFDISCEFFFIAVSIPQTDTVVLMVIHLALLKTDAIEDLTSHPRTC